MAKHLDKFIRPFRESRIPFLLAEVITNGSGEMVDAVCRFLNPAAADLLQLSAEEVRDRRFSQFFAPWSPRDLAPLQAVAFSGSAASFRLPTAAGAELSVTCYQVMYGTVGCLLEPLERTAGAQMPALPDSLPCADLELSREGVRCLACSRRLCQLLQRDQRILLAKGGRAFSSFVEPSDWPPLLQALLDAEREGVPSDQDLRLLRQNGSALWVNFRGEILSSRPGCTVFRGTFWDIDQLRRRELSLQNTLARREIQLRQAQQLLDRLPVGLCLLRLRPGDTAEVLQVNRELTRLLGSSADALAQNLMAQPEQFLSSGEWSGLRAAALQARAAHLPLSRQCRVRSAGGREFQLAVRALWEQQADETWLLYAVCADVTQEAQAEAEHLLRSKLCDLLLERSSLLTLDYDPAADLARIERHSPDGRRTVRTISGYIKSLATAAYLHPDDRRRLAAAVRKAGSRPGSISHSYRANYDGTGWRWYQVSWMSLFDENGDVRRLLGKAEDMTRRRAGEARFRYLTTRHRRESRTCLASARLDLTADQTLDAKAASRYLLRTLFDRTSGACLQRLAAAVPEGTCGQFETLFSPESLFSAYTDGDFQRSLDHVLDAGRGAFSVRTTVEVAENPDTSHLEAFLQVRDLRSAREMDSLLETLLDRDYLLVMAVDAAGICRAYGPGAKLLPEGASCRSLAAWYLRQLPPSPERASLRRALTLERVSSRLESAPVTELTIPGLQGRPLLLRCSRPEGLQDILLVTCRAVDR